MTIIDAMADAKLFRTWFGGSTWDAWRVFLRVLFGLPLDVDDAMVYERHTKRSVAPQSTFREAWLVVGRRGGKSLVASLVAVFLACFKDYASLLKPGEVGTIAIIAADRRQARTILRYIRGFLDLPMLKKMVLSDTQESIELKNRVVIEVHTASFRSVRGYTLLAVIADEIAFWRSEDSANPDKEILQAVRPGLATIPGSLLLCISSPYARRGALWETYTKHFGKDSPVLVWQAESKAMNPALDQSVIDQAYEEDEAAASAEYGAQFRKDLEAFIAREAVTACVIPDRRELPYQPGVQYRGFVDPSGGSNDSMTLAIAHMEGNKTVLDCVRERKAPFSPDDVTKEFAATLWEYGLASVTGDRYAGEWPRERFKVHGVTYELADKTRSEIYLALLPMLNSHRVELLDNPRLTSQLLNLERRTARGGKDSVDHAPGAHDDLINAAAGAVVLASKPVFKWRAC